MATTIFCSQKQSLLFLWTQKSQSHSSIGFSQWFSGFFRAKADTLLLVDITTDKETWNSGFGKQFIDAALEVVAQKTPYSFIFTYTPAEPGVRRWHLKNGATETYHRIVCARPGHRTEDVCLMEYTAEIARRRPHREKMSKPETLNPPSGE